MLQTRFDAGYRALYGRMIPGVEIEVVGWILTRRSAAPAARAELPMAAAGEGGAPAAVGTRKLFEPTLREFADVAGLCSRRAEARRSRSRVRR